MTSTAETRSVFRFDANTRLAEFLSSTRFVDVIEGPLGSGKTVALCLRIMRHAQEQRKSPLDGLRKTRWAIVRNSYPDLKRTTIRTWLDTFPEDLYGRFFWGQPPSHRISFDDVRLEIDFLALDKPEDIRKLRSGEYTGIAFNELPFIEKEIFDEATSRVGRYPPMRDGGPNWCGVICDANAPDEDHWLAVMTGQVDLPPGLTQDEIDEYRWPPEWGFYLQPPALIERLGKQGEVLGYTVNPKAENLHNLPPDYYAKQVAGKKKSWIDSRLMVRVVLVVEGSPVWPMFRREFHVAPSVLVPVERREVIIGLDFGRTPAAIFAQEVGNRVFVQHELLGVNESAESFAPKVKRFLEKHYVNCPFRCVGDPKGRDKGQATDATAFDIFAGYGMKVVPAPVRNNSIEDRVEAVAHILNDNPAGTNRLVLSPRVRTLIVGMAGRYYNEKDETGELKPCKDKYSHPCDALQYLVLGLGEGRAMRNLTAANAPKPVSVNRHRGARRRVA